MASNRHQDVFTALVSTIRAASVVAGQDVPFYKKLDQGISERVDTTGRRLLDLANALVQNSVPGEMYPLESTEDLEEKWGDLSNVIDLLFEKTDIALDQVLRSKDSLSKVKTGNSAVDSSTREGSETPKTPLTVLDSSAGRVVTHARTISKPQESFKRRASNSNDHPFRPKITSKPNALIPLEKSLELIDSDNRQPYFESPYKTEIETQDYPKSVRKFRDPIKSLPWSSSTAIYVDTEEALKEMLSELKKSKEIAIDLEHHDYRSFYGFVCLMQISNREQDWIVDTLILRHELQVLNEVFTNPKIVKVLHGAFMDIMWLQRDFGLYVVSLFDTYFAAKALGLKRHGLAFLLETYADFQTSKKYQLADWRVRPLPKEMLAYARADTHFLLYIYDQLKNELLSSHKQDKLGTVLNESRAEAAQRYEIPGYDLDFTGNSGREGWKSISYKYNLDQYQQIIAKDLYQWRDKVARENDESPRFIMPNHLLVSLAIAMPTDVPTIMNMSNGMTAHVRAKAKDLADLIAKDKLQIDALKDQDDSAFEQPHQEPELSSIDLSDQSINSYLLKFNQAQADQEIFKEEPQLQLTQSSFWGECLDQTDSGTNADNKANLQLYVPLPALTADPFNITVPSNQHKPFAEIVPAHKFIKPSTNSEESEEVSEEEKDDDDDDVIIIKEVSAKRKREEELVEESLKEDEIQNDHELDEIELPEADVHLNSKERRKAKRKLKALEKKASKELKTKGKEENGNDEIEHVTGSAQDDKVAKKSAKKAARKETKAKQEAEVKDSKGASDHASTSKALAIPAFDYDTAPSVLKPSNSRAGGKFASKNSKKAVKTQFNQFAGDNDGPKAAKRLKTTVTGRTMTFKNKKKKKR